MAQREDALVEVEDRVRVFRFAGDVVRFVTGRNGEPRGRGAETRVGLVVPLHGRAFAVPAFFFRPTAAPDRIFHVIFTFGIVVLHATFFAVIHDGRAAQGEIEASHKFRDVVVIDTVT